MMGVAWACSAEDHSGLAREKAALRGGIAVNDTPADSIPHAVSRLARHCVKAVNLLGDMKPSAQSSRVLVLRVSVPALTSRRTLRSGGALQPQHRQCHCHMQLLIARLFQTPNNPKLTWRIPRTSCRCDPAVTLGYSTRPSWHRRVSGDAAVCRPIRAAGYPISCGLRRCVWLPQ